MKYLVNLLSGWFKLEKPVKSIESVKFPNIEMVFTIFDVENVHSLQKGFCDSLLKQLGKSSKSGLSVFTNSF